MANGLNKQFQRDPVAFLRSHFYTVKDQNMPTGRHRVSFVIDAGGRVMLEKFLGNPGPFQHPFECYFLKALPDARNLGAVLSAQGPHWFFTSTLTGCQVMAHGTRQAPCVEHNNCLNIGAGQYDRFSEAIEDVNPLFRVHNGGLYDVGNGHMGNVVGRYLPLLGWQFLFQKIEDRTVSVNTVY